MKIVIDISDENYNVIIANADFYKEKHWGDAEVWDAIVGGVPLPKGHGRLIDADAKNKELVDEYHGMISDESIKIYKIIQMLDDAPTIIEADKETDNGLQ